MYHIHGLNQETGAYSNSDHILVFSLLKLPSSLRNQVLPFRRIPRKHVVWFMYIGSSLICRRTPIILYKSIGYLI